MPGVPGIGIGRANYQLPHPRLDNRIGTRPGSARGRTGFERHIQDRAFRDWLLVTADAFDFRMWPARAFVVAPGDNPSINYQDRSNRRMGARLAEPTACLKQGRAHKNFVAMRGCHMQRYLAFGAQANGSPLVTT